MNKKRILIGITTAETVHYETMQSIYELDVPEDVETVLKVVHSYNVAEGRNKLVSEMYTNNCDFIFFVDSDVVLPKNALVDLYNMNWYFCAGTYPRKELATLTDEVVYTTLYWHEESNKEKYCPKFMPFNNLQPGFIYQIDACGFGCVLLRRDLLDSLPKPYFVFATEKGEDEYCLGEDLYFCRQVIRNGGQMWAHGSVLCEHIGKFFYKFKY